MGQWVNWSDRQLKIAEENKQMAILNAERLQATLVDLREAYDQLKVQRALVLKLGQQAEVGKMVVLSSGKRTNNQPSEALLLAFAALEMAEEKTPEMWRALGGAALDTLSEPSVTYELPVQHVWHLEKSRGFIFLHSDHSLSFFDSRNKKTLKLGPPQNEMPQLAISSNEQWIAYTIPQNRVRILDLNTLESRIVMTHDRPVYQLLFSPDNKYLVSTAGDKMVKCWSVDTRTQMVFNDHTAAIYELSFSPDSQYLLGRSAGRTLFLWALSEEKLIDQLQAHDIYIRDIAWSKNGQYMVSAGSDGKVKIWDDQGALTKTIDHQDIPVMKAVFSPDPERVFSLRQDKQLLISSARGDNTDSRPVIDQKVHLLAFTNEVMAAFLSKGIAILSPQGDILTTFGGHDDLPFFVNKLDAPDLYLSTSRDGTAQLWNPQGEVFLSIELDPVNPLPAFWDKHRKGVYYFEKENKRFKFIALPQFVYNYMKSNRMSFQTGLEQLKRKYQLSFYDPSF